MNISIISLLTYIAIIGLGLTLLQKYMWKIPKSIFMSFLQNFTGILFLFSGWVKAVDPLGTAFKLDDYFAEFYVTFEGTAMSFIAPLFPLLSEYSIAFSVFMIIFEIILGLMLLMGDRPKLTAWLFFALVAFFTALTGFTFLTGYVPSGVNFFDFGSWGEYQKSNMRVTDCGCFGDFIKLEPRTSFFKDIFLLFPAFYFLWMSKDMHTIWTNGRRNWILILSTIGLLLYCVYNFYWNEPHVDFRPFTNATDIAAKKKNEIDASHAVKILFMKMKNKKTGEIKSFSYDEYLKNLSAITEEYETIEQIKTEPLIKETKASQFEVTNFDGDDKTGPFLEGESARLMIPIYKAKYASIPSTRTVRDSIFANDTISVKIKGRDTISVTKTFVEVKQRQEEYYEVVWDEDFLSTLKTVIKPIVDAAAKDKVETSVVISGIDNDKAQSLALATGINAEYLTADEKLLKTIMRSNPGVILWKKGVLLHKWHYKKVPAWADIKAEYLK